MSRPSYAVMSCVFRTLTTLAIMILCFTGCAAEVGSASGIAIPTNAVSGQGSANDSEREPFYQIIPNELKERGASGRENHDTALKLLGRGTTARVVDRDGNVLQSAATDGSMYGLQMSPGGDLALIYYGDATYTVAHARDLDTARALPVAPPDLPDATGFGWHWLDDDHLLGAASLPSTDTEGKTAAEIEGTPPRATLLYVYRLKDGILTPVHIDPALPESFMIYETADWNVSLVNHDDELVGAKIEQVPEP